MIRNGFSFLSLLFILFLACSGNRNTKGTSEARISDNDTVSTGLEIGQRAPELEFSSPNGDKIALSSLRGQMVLIDFWASWCMPCRLENPNLVKVYNLYKDKNFEGGDGFTIYSVSLDTDKEAWERGIEKDNLEWGNHVSDLQGWNAAPAATYGVVSIPANFLIDGNGIIIAKDLRAGALEETISRLVR